MSTEAASNAMTASSDKEAAYRQHLADTILEYVTDKGAIETPEAYRRVIAVTGRQLSTIKNWLSYRTNLPDLASLARIVEHWKIPPESIFPSRLEALLSGAAISAAAVVENASHRSAFADHTLISLYGPGDVAKVDRVLSKYTDHPK